MSGNFDRVTAVDWNSVFSETAAMLAPYGVAVDWWSTRQPLPRIVLHLIQSCGQGLDLEGALARLERMGLGAVDSADIPSEALKEVYGELSHVVQKIRSLVTEGDDAISGGQVTEAVKSYRAAAELLKGPAIELEIAGLVFYRTKLDEKPYTERDFAGVYCWGDPWELGSYIAEDLQDGPTSSETGPLLDLSLDLCGRYVLFMLREMATAGDVYDDRDIWRFYPALDGLRVALLAKLADELQLRHLCKLFHLWKGEHGYYVSGDPDLQDNLFAHRFEYLRGYLDGKDVGASVAVASVLSKTQPPRRGATRADIADRLKAAFGELWPALDDFVKEPLIEGESLFELFKDKDRTDYGAVVLEYAKAIEYLLRSITGSRERILGDCGDPVNSPLRNRLKPGAPFDKIVNDIRTLSSARNRWAHGYNPIRARRISLSEAESLRELALGLMEELTKWRRI